MELVNIQLQVMAEVQNLDYYVKAVYSKTNREFQDIYSILNYLLVFSSTWTDDYFLDVILFTTNFPK